jgi:hypothetical protein
MLAWGYTSIEINGQRALNCIVHLRQLDQSVEDAVIGYVALKAYIELKKYPEARTEFMGLLTASDVPLAIYLQAITVRATVWLHCMNGFASIIWMLCTAVCQFSIPHSHVLQAIVQIPGGMTSIQEVARAVLERFPTETSILVHIVKCLIDLGPSKVG